MRVGGIVEYTTDELQVFCDSLVKWVFLFSDSKDLLFDSVGHPRSSISFFHMLDGWLPVVCVTMM